MEGCGPGDGAERLGRADSGNSVGTILGRGYYSSSGGLNGLSVQEIEIMGAIDPYCCSIWLCKSMLRSKQVPLLVATSYSLDYAWFGTGLPPTCHPCISISAGNRWRSDVL